MMQACHDSMLAMHVKIDGELWSDSDEGRTVAI